MARLYCLDTIAGSADYTSWAEARAVISRLVWAYDDILLTVLDKNYERIYHRYFHPGDSIPRTVAELLGAKGSQ